MQQLWQDLGLSPWGALAVVISASTMYTFFAIVLHTWGERLRNPGSVVTMALAALMGSIAARSILGNHPTLAGGLLALSTLLVLERVFGALVSVRRQHAARSAGD